MVRVIAGKIKCLWYPGQAQIRCLLFSRPSLIPPLLDNHTGPKFLHVKAKLKVVPTSKVYLVLGSSFLHVNSLQALGRHFLSQTVPVFRYCVFRTSGVSVSCPGCSTTFGDPFPLEMILKVGYQLKISDIFIK